MESQEKTALTCKIILELRQNYSMFSNFHFDFEVSKRIRLIRVFFRKKLEKKKYAKKAKF